mgnify:CR=1 FL=1
MKRVCIYARVSTDKQSTDRQVEQLREIAKNHEWEVVSEFVDICSGAKTSRPNFDQMMKDAFSRKFETVMCLELSRIGRNTKHLLDTVEKLDSKKIDLYIHNQQIDTSTPTGKLFFTVASAFSNFERDLIRERVVSGLQNAKKKGKILGRRSNLTHDVKIQIEQLRKEGIGIKKIAKKFHVAPDTIRKMHLISS